MDAHRLTDEKLEIIESHLTDIYLQEQKEIQEEAYKFFSKFREADERKRDLLKRGKITEADYKKWYKAKIMRGKQFTLMKENIAKKLLNVNQIATAYINGKLPEIYALNYNAFEKTAKQIEGYSFHLLNADTVKNLAELDKNFLPFRILDPAKDIPWNMKNINSQVLKGILNGESVSEIADRIQKVQDMNRNAALRSARTIVTSAENKGRLDSYKKAEDDGVILEKMWISTHDDRTRDWHDELNEVSVPVEEPFVNSVGEIMYPGDPDADGENVYNCRCTLVSNIIGFKKVK